MTSLCVRHLATVDLNVSAMSIAARIQRVCDYAVACPGMKADEGLWADDFFTLVIGLAQILDVRNADSRQISGGGERFSEDYWRGRMRALHPFSEDSGILYQYGIRYYMDARHGQRRIRLDNEWPKVDAHHAHAVIRNGFCIFPMLQNETGTYKFALKRYNEGYYQAWLEAYEFMIQMGVAYVIDDEAIALMRQR